MSNAFHECGTLLTAIRQSEKSRDKAHASANERHKDRVQRLLAAATPEARDLVVKHLAPVTGTELAEKLVDGSTAWLNKEPEPMQAVTIDRTGAERRRR